MKTDLIKELRTQIFDYLQEINNQNLLPKVNREIKEEKGYKLIEAQVIEIMVDNNFTVPEALNEIEQTL